MATNLMNVILGFREVIVTPSNVGIQQKNGRWKGLIEQENLAERRATQPKNAPNVGKTLTPGDGNGEQSSHGIRDA